MECLGVRCEYCELAFFYSPQYSISPSARIARKGYRINKSIPHSFNYVHSTSKNTCRIDHIIGIKSIQVFNEYLPPKILLLPLFLQFLEQFESHALTHSSSSFQRPCLRHPIPSHSCLQLLLHSTLH